jgi:creatinine amidohydrolase/Fe(II)-dependent formamide hydrolase-like protein
VVETSITMYLTPEIGKWDDLREGKPVERHAEIAEAKKRGVHKPVEGLDRVVTPWRAKLISDTGTGPPGDMREATVERGEEYIEKVISTMVEMCRAISTGDYDLPVWEDYP